VSRSTWHRTHGLAHQRQAYNVQVAVDELQLIVGQAVTQDTNDKHQLMPMITTIEQTVR
jgi:hypothetical protein